MVVKFYDNNEWFSTTKGNTTQCYVSIIEHKKRFGEDITFSIDDMMYKNIEDVDNILFQYYIKNGITVFESLPSEQSVKQLKKVDKLSKDTDIGNRIEKESGSNLDYIHNPIDDVESYEDFCKRNKDFDSNWNLKGKTSPFKKIKKRD